MSEQERGLHEMEPESTSQKDPLSDLFAGGTSAPVESRRARRRAPARNPKRRRFVWLIAIIMALALIAAAVLVVFKIGGSLFGGAAGPDYEGDGNGETLAFTIMEGDTGTVIAERLESEGVVKDSSVFLKLVLNTSPEPVFYPGTYELQKEMSAASALRALTTDAKRVENTLTIPEGTTAKQIYELIHEQTNIPLEELTALGNKPQEFGLPSEAKTLEGFLFPATYKLEPGLTAKQILTKLVDRMHQALEEHEVPKDRVWDVIRMASLVQREAGLAPDYPKVARVFQNRLDKDMPLQSDATVTYGTGNYHRVTTTDAERADASNPYNTYAHRGMIPAPISNPGDLAIEAAMHPADGTWLYFVTVNLDTGETVFSDTYDEHLKAVAQWQEWMKDHPEYDN